MDPIVIAVGAAFSALGAAAERLASVWPSDEATGRRPGARTLGLAAVAGLAGALLASRSELAPWATAVYLAFVAVLVLLAATDLEQRRLPHLLLDPLVVGAAAWVPFNPAVQPVSALIGAAAAVGFLGALTLIVRGGLAIGDLYLVAPIGTLLGWPSVFLAIFIASLLAAVASLVLLTMRRVGMRSYIPFGPFLVAGAVIALALGPGLGGTAGLPPGWRG
ncbi:MAG TPA: A24 family peptidase [Candidatus Limnocylindria bacterium]|nr:A24 family peptidase [Candidatus Limnocylindria bacterium]